MHEQLLERVVALELANRRLRTTLMALMIALVLLFVLAGLAVYGGFRILAVYEADLQAARQDAAAARRHVEQALPSGAKATP